MWIKHSPTRRWLVNLQRVSTFLAFVTLVLSCSLPLHPVSNLLETRSALNIRSDIDKSVDLQHAFGQLPLYFVENRGQMDERVAYYIQGRDKTIYFTSEGVTFAFARSDSDELTPHPKPVIEQSIRHDIEQEHPATPPYSRWAVKLDFVGANPTVRPVAQEPAEAVISYFKGQPDEWHSDLRTYHKLVYPNLWPGIDLVYYGTVNQMKYEFIVRPGADPGAIRLTYRGTTGVHLNDAGQLEVNTPLGGFTDDTPVAYQEIDGQRIPVSIAYALEPQHFVSLNQQPYGFRVGEYDPSHPLVLDPAVLVYAGYIGGSSYEYGNAIAVDSAGNAYVTGDTNSDQTTFPVAGGPDLTYNGGSRDAFVAKVNADGTALIYAGYIGGDSYDEGNGIAVDDAGNAYIAGETWSTEDSFPVTGGPDLTLNGGTEVFVAKVNAAGTTLVYAGYIGGISDDEGHAIAIDGAGNAYVTGNTISSDFPTTGGPDLFYNGFSDAFVAKVQADGTALVYSGFIGGSDADNAHGIAVDGAGNAYITGQTNSDQITFPVTGGPDLTHNGGGQDTFVVKVQADGIALVYAGYIGGSNSDYGWGVAVDDAGNAYVAGHTSSAEDTFPTTGGPDLTHNGGNDVFVAKVQADGLALVYAGYIGGASGEMGYGIAIDDTGNVYVTGQTNSDETTFPVTGGPDPTFNGDTFYPDAFVAKVQVDGTALVYAGYIGGSFHDYSYAIAVDDVGNAYVTGYTLSTETTFPVVGGPDLTHNGGSQDAFVAKVGEGAADSFLFLPLVIK